MSLYRTSIFPAAMVLTCKDIVTQGPMRVGLGVKETDENVSTEVRDTENIDATVFVDAMAGAMDSWASKFALSTSFFPSCSARTYSVRSRHIPRHPDRFIERQHRSQSASRAGKMVTNRGLSRVTWLQLINYKF